MKILLLLLFALSVGAEFPLSVSFRLEKPGKLTLAIDDAQGNRVRNLVSGRAMPAGAGTVQWDARDDNGNPVPPGIYTVRGLTHPGLRYRLIDRFCNGGEPEFTPWGPNHSVFSAFAAAGPTVFAGAPVAEGGDSLVALTCAGKKIRGFAQTHGAGEHATALAVDRDVLLAVKDGYWSNGNCWKITLNRYRIANGAILPFGRAQFKELLHIPVKNSPPLTRRYERIANMDPTPSALTGAAVSGGKLFVAVAPLGRVLAFDPVNGERLNAISIPVAAPGPLTDGVLGDGRQLLRYNPANGKTEPLCDLPYQPRGLARWEKFLAVSGNPDHTVEIRDVESGRLLGKIGEPGETVAGPRRPRQMQRPTGVGFDAEGMLWIAENRWNPKRITRWNPRTGELLLEKFGSPGYGSPSAGFDPENPDLWVGLHAVWNRAARTVPALTHSELLRCGAVSPARSYRIVRHRDTRYAIGTGPVVTLSVWESSGAFRDVAAVTRLDALRREMNYRPHPVLEQAAAAVAARPESGVLWRDRNGNGRFDADEFEFTPPGIVLGWGWWGACPATVEIPLFFLSPDTSRPRFGWLDLSGTAGTLAETMRRARPITGKYPSGIQKIGRDPEYASDCAGTVWLQTEPSFTILDRTGRVRGAFPNRHAGMHGSHSAPLPRVGEPVGIFYASGTAPLLDADSRVFAWQGNHGPVYFLTSDGLYLDALFQDCRVAELHGPDLLGGEPFGGTFDYSPKTGKWYFQGGPGGFRVYTIENLNQIRRFESKLTVSEAALSSASGTGQNREIVPQTLVIPYRSRLDAVPPPLTQWGDAPRNIRLSADYDQNVLRLQFEVSDESPWRNRGTDWTAWFKTGDSVDWQLQSPAGPLRVAVAPGGVVLYRFAGPERQPVDFSSPVRHLRVPEVRKLENLRPAVRIVPGGYAVHAEIPWREIGIAPPTAGTRFAGDFGVIFGDAAGTVNLARVYRFNRATGLVNDIPGELEPAPARWGMLQFAPPGQRGLRFAGVLGNSGTSANPVRVSRGTGVSAAGPVWVPERNLLFVTAGDSRINAYTPEGRPGGEFPIPPEPVASGAFPLVRCGKYLTLLRNGKLYRLPVDAISGTPAEVVPGLSHLIALADSARQNTVTVLRRDGLTATVNPETGAVRELGKIASPGAVNSIVQNPDGSRLVFRHRTAEPFPSGGPARTVFGPRELGAVRVLRIGEFLYVSCWNSTLKQLQTEDYTASPGVILGGRGGHYIGWVFTNWEIGVVGGVAPMPTGNVMISGRNGVVYEGVRDDSSRLRLIRRIGSVPHCGALEIDGSGRVLADGAVWNWDDAPDAPPATTLRVRPAASVRLDRDRFAVVGELFGKFGVAAGRLVEREHLEGQLDRPPPKSPAALVSGGDRVRVIEPDGTFFDCRIQAGPSRLRCEAVETGKLEFAAPAGPISSAARLDADRILVAAAGKLIEFRGNREIARRPETFAPGCNIAVDGPLLAISERSRNRITLLDLRNGKKLAVQPVEAPGAVAVNGSRIAVYETTQQRICKYQWND